MRNRKRYCWQKPERLALQRQSAIGTAFGMISRRYILEITEGLVPALQRRGLVRTEYTKSTLRDTLKEF